ncbi:MAG: RNA polymerase sigma factor [Dehalococcoidia bacterium]|nr:RNA polymerase sigma factor [Dehalococcoidia bacterium]
MADHLPRVFGRDPSSADLSIDAERSLVERAARGDQRAVGALYDHYVASLYRFCLARVGNDTDAEDLTEEIFLKVMRSVGGFEWRPLPLVDGLETRSPFRAWLFRIARNHVVSHYRRTAARPTAGEVPEWLPDDRRGPQEMAELAITVEEVFAAVQDLPHAQRDVIMLRFGSGLSVAETAEALEKQQTNVKVLQHKGIKKLKEILVEARHTPATSGSAGGTTEES